MDLARTCRGNICLGAVLCVAALLCGIAEAQSSTVRTKSQAVAIAKRACKLTLGHDKQGLWHATRGKTSWFVWMDPDRAAEVNIETKTGEPTVCAVLYRAN